ncbi:putative cytosol aminopeptidase [Clostridium polyendosporum]|uniref:Probable cytosol aminopeptidase n=1 Tax=Clostridium polyendosporum TaxID=69208 RepID=A0A919RYT8_9CLOT|nr:leucyl aminopeptidase [Clostridium polyendosporum]GIM29045.1 putative cytosol aminopeptidase [Clostridium polyendosporum]
MNIGFKKFACTGGDIAITCLFEDRLQTPNNEVNSIVQYFNNKGSFKGANGEIASFFRTINGITQDFIVVGLGKEAEVDSEKIRRALGKAVKKAIELKSKKIFVRIIPTEVLTLKEIVKAMVEGMGLAAYKFDKYKSDNKSEAVLEFSLGSPDIDDLRAKEVDEIIEEAKDLVEATELARNLVNEPANVIYPETLAQEAVKAGNEGGFEVEVFDKSKIEDLKMNAFLCVARGSNNEPRFIIMRYFGDQSNKEKVLGFVGKGVTYDSGGYSLKPNESMVTMKSDMGGAAAVIGAMSAIAKRKLKINIIAVVAACENLISGNAYKPGDVISSMAGKSIEILNTDAEGRLTLIDAVHYIIEKEKVSEVIDVATLTGAALVALGTTTTAVVTNNQEFYKELEDASKISGEKIWQLPTFPDYKKMLKSHIADLKNVGGRHAGTITAGLFIGEFVQNKPWLHLDIAGTSWTDSPTDYCPKGGTGAGVRTFYELAKNRC